ncbi:alpha/beta hydrolase [soil metagenome]
MTGKTSKPTPLPEMQAVLDQLAHLGAEPLETLIPEQARKQPSPADAVNAVARIRGLDAEPESVGNLSDRTFEGPGGTVALRLYWPKDADPGTSGLPVVLYIHGGGWVIADIDTYDASARAVANAAGAIVVSTHYRQAPEHKFPAAHEDTMAAYRWVLDNAAAFGGDPRRIALVGESAGGNMAANIAISARDQGLQAPVHQVLVYPVANNDMQSPSYLQNANASPLGKAAMAWFVRYTFHSADETADPRISLARRSDLAGLPATTIILAELDPLRSEGELLGEALRDADVPVLIHQFDGVTHEFFGMGAVLEEARLAQQLAGQRLAQAFEDQPPHVAAAARTTKPGAAVRQTRR